MDHERNGSGYVSEMKWDVGQDDKRNENGMKAIKGNGKNYWWNMIMIWSETAKIKQSEVRWVDEFAESKLQSDCSFLSLLIIEIKWKI